MVKTRSSHSRMPPAPQQRRLGRQKKTVHRRASPLALQKRQSTLTQLDYVRTPQSSRRETVSISSDEDEYEEVQSRKRRKITNGGKDGKRLPDQSTLTQKWTTPIFPRTVSSEIGDSEDEDDLHATRIGLRPQGDRHHPHTTTGDSDRAIEDSDDADGAESEASSKPWRHTRFLLSPKVEEQDTRPTTADVLKNTQPTTPGKPRRTEIPSSVSPESIHTSTRSARSFVHYVKSPLSERSVNIASPQRHSLLRTATVAEPLVVKIPQDLKTDDVQSKTRTAQVVMTPKKDRQVAQRTFRRTATVQDSEDEDLELNDSPVSLKLMSVKKSQQKSEVESQTPQWLKITALQGEGQSLNRPQQYQGDENIPEWKRTGLVLDSEESYIDSSRLPTDSSIPTQRSQNKLESVGHELNQSATREDALKGCGKGIQDKVPAFEDIAPQIAGSQAFGISPTQLIKLQSLGRPGSTDTHLNIPTGRTDVTATRTQSTNTTAADAAQPSSDVKCDEHAPMSYSDGEVRENENPVYPATQYPQTYDPVAAALDRDAARFGKTETQLEREDWHLSEDEEESLDLDQRTGFAWIAKDQDTGTDRVPSSQTPETRVQSSPETIEMIHISPRRIPPTTAQSSEVDDSGYCSQLSVNAIITIPSSQPKETSTCSLDEQQSSTAIFSESNRVVNAVKELNDSMPTPGSPSKALSKPHLGHQMMQQPHDEAESQWQLLRASQISTACNSQSELSRPNSLHGESLETTTPTRVAATWHETVPSSPFPLPPGMTTQGSWWSEYQVGSLADFSLPPPPSMFFATRQRSGESEL